MLFTLISCSFLAASHGRPSMFVYEERGIRNWRKHQQKQLNAGELKNERNKMFKQLLELWVENKHKSMIWLDL